MKQRKYPKYPPATDATPAQLSRALLRRPKRRKDEKPKANQRVIRPVYPIR